MTHTQTQNIIQIDYPTYASMGRPPMGSPVPPRNRLIYSRLSSLGSASVIRMWAGWGILTAAQGGPRCQVGSIRSGLSSTLHNAVRLCVGDEHENVVCVRIHDMFATV